MIERFRERRAVDFLARALVGILFAMFATNLFQDFLRTGHLTGLLLLVSESLVVVFTVGRRRATLVDHSVAAVVVTTLCLAGPSLLRTGDEVAMVPDSVTTVISALGLVLVVLAKVTLGRSFGLIPANRGVVVRGPYALVRHPIYAGYLVTHVAFLLAQPTAWNVAVLAVADGLLVVRALMEERVLKGDAQYELYCRRVSWHLVPGVF